MINLKEFVSRFVDIDESLLDDIDDTLAAGDEYVETEQIKKWALNDKCKIYKNKKGYGLIGDFRITGIDDAKYAGPRIRVVQGNISIVNTKLESLEGIFNPDTEITGSFAVEDNDKLTSLKGCPMTIRGSLTISNNKSLKDIDVSPEIYMNAYVSRNGKKFKKDELSQKLNVYKHIFCNADDELCIDESTINEAFKAPQLKLVADSIKKAKAADSKFSFIRLTDIEWDKINASDVTEYDITDPKSQSIARKYISGKSDGVLVFIDNESDVYAIVIRDKILTIKPRFGEKPTNGWIPRGQQKLDGYSSADVWKQSDIIDRLFKNNNGLNLETMMVVDFSSLNRMDLYNKKSARYNARQGAVALMRGEEKDPNNSYYGVRYYSDILQKNKERYKKLLTQIRAERAAKANNFTNIKRRLDDVFNRYTALLEKILVNPSKYNDYDVNWLNDKFNQAYQGKTRWSGITEFGLFPAIERYFQYIIQGTKGTKYGNKDTEAQMRELEDAIIKNLKSVEEKITELESI